MIQVKQLNEFLETEIARVKEFKRKHHEMKPVDEEQIEFCNGSLFAYRILQDTINGAGLAPLEHFKRRIQDERA